MIIVGLDDYGFPLGIGRYVHSMFGSTLPGTFSTKDCAVEVSSDYMAYKNSEQFEVLCDGDVDWIEAGYGGAVHPQSVEGGLLRGHETLYVGKVIYEEKLVIGKIHPKGGMYIAWNGYEEQITEHYFQLIDKNKVMTTEAVFSLPTTSKNLLDWFKRGRRYQQGMNESLGGDSSRFKSD